MNLNEEGKAVIRKLFPNLILMSNADLCLAFGGIVEAGHMAESCGAQLVCDFYSRVLMALEVERERRGFASYNDLLQASMASFVEGGAGNDVGKIN